MTTWCYFKIMDLINISEFALWVLVRNLRRQICYLSLSVHGHGPAQKVTCFK